MELRYGQHSLITLFAHYKYLNPEQHRWIDKQLSRIFKKKFTIQKTCLHMAQNISGVFKRMMNLKRVTAVEFTLHFKSLPSQRKLLINGYIGFENYLHMKP